MVNDANHSTIKTRHQSRNEFYVQFENHFLVLPDGKTIVGVDGSDLKKLMIEDITSRNPRPIGTNDGEISNVLFDSLTQSLLVGDFDGHLKQYKKVNQSFTIVKDYGELDVGCVLSSTQVGRFAIFGGNNRSLVAIDICEQQDCSGLIKSPFGWTNSLQVCEDVNSNVYLSLGGICPDYSSDASDYLDMTLLYNDQKKDSPKLPEKMDQPQASLDEKYEIIKSLNLKIKQLESSLKKQAKQNQGTSNKKTSKTKTSPSTRRSTLLQLT